jgi:hypothetical protein
MKYYNEEIKDKKGLLLSLGLVLKCEAEKAKEIIEQLKATAEVVYIKTSYGRLWIKEDYEGSGFSETTEQ